MSFTHLHVHTQYSLLDGASKIPNLVKRAKELGMDSIAITDHGVMYGVIDFYRACKAEGIKPIIGCEVYVAPGSRFDKNVKKGDEKYYHLVLLAENDVGYSNLSKIVSRGFTEGFYYKPRVDREVLKEFHEGIIALSACLAGEVATNLRSNDYEAAKQAALDHLEIFGKDNYFLELQDHGMSAQKLVNQGIMRLHEETGIPLVATNDLHYINQEDWESHDILLCIQTGSVLSDPDRMRYDGGQYYLKSEEEMRALFPYAKEAIDNTAKIAERCNVEIVFGEQKLPKYTVPEPYTSYEYLEKLCKEGLERRYSPVKEEHKKRLEYELETISKMGYVDYFLIVWDFIKYAKDHDIPVGPGRGSAAGSIVSYCLGITNIDPIRYSLIFERFLNPERVSMPDIDVDISDEDRQKVIDYVTEKYGKECVVQIITFGTMGAKMVVRDVGRVLDMPYAVRDRIAKMIPGAINGKNVSIEEAIAMIPDLKNEYENDPDIRYLLDMSKMLEGLPRHTSTHAAGVVIGAKPIENFVPLSKGSGEEDPVTTQFTMTTIEELGLLKMDFLGLRTLSVIQNAVKNVKMSRGIDIDIDNIDIEDKKVYELIGSGYTEGIFQLESGGMKDFMRNLKPESIEDIIAGISLYRPGPMQFKDDYIDRKRHPEKITYLCPQLEKILAPTYGCITYQEQVMQIVMELAGYTLGRSDLVRRAMSKKKAAVMEKERNNFVYGNEEEGVDGCIKRGVDEEVANRIFDEMMDFAAYAFNKSHAACYAVVAYQTAFLKTYYPAEFMAALITSVLDRTDKVAEYVAHCRKLGIEVLPPDVNQGYSRFSVVDGKIIYGLSALKGVGRNVIYAMVDERRLHGPFKDLRDFVVRLGDKGVNKKVVESLIKAGAFDCMGANRRQMMMTHMSVIEDAAGERKNNMAGQMSLFDIMDEEDKEQFKLKYPDVEEYAKGEKLALEKEVLGMYVSGHPLEDWTDLIDANITKTTGDFILDDETGSVNVNNDEPVIVGGVLSVLDVKITKKQQQMAIITLEDMRGTVEIVVFPKAFGRYKHLFTQDAKILVKGRATVEEDQARVIADEFVSFYDVPKRLYLNVEDKDDFDKKEASIKECARKHIGDASLVVVLTGQEPLQVRTLDEKVSPDEGCIEDFIKIVGKDKAVAKYTKAFRVRK